MTHAERDQLSSSMSLAVKTVFAYHDAEVLHHYLRLSLLPVDLS